MIWREYSVTLTYAPAYIHTRTHSSTSKEQLPHWLTGFCISFTGRSYTCHRFVLKKQVVLQVCQVYCNRFCTISTIIALGARAFINRPTAAGFNLNAAEQTFLATFVRANQNDNSNLTGFIVVVFSFSIPTRRRSSSFKFRTIHSTNWRSRASTATSCAFPVLVCRSRQPRALHSRCLLIRFHCRLEMQSPNRVELVESSRAAPRRAPSIDLTPQYAFSVGVIAWRIVAHLPDNAVEWRSFVPSHSTDFVAYEEHVLAV